MGSKSTTTTNKNSPPAWAKPLFERSAGDAMSLYESGKGFQPYEGQRVADINGMTQNGINSIQGGMSTLNGAARMPHIYGTAGTQNLEKIARGGMINSNPYMNGMLAKSTDQIKSLYSGAGRYGSGANQAVVGENANDMLSKNYQFERGQMLDAGNILANRRGADFGNSLSLAGQRFGAANQQLGAGNMLQAHDQAKLDAARNLFNEKQNIDWTRLGALQAAAQGAAGSYGTQSQTSRQPFNPLSIIGALGSFMMPGAGPMMGAFY